MTFGMKVAQRWLLGTLMALIAIAVFVPSARASADGNLETGYHFVDSRDPLGPAPGQWEEIEPPVGLGTGLTFADQDDGSQPLPNGFFRFMFWGQPQSTCFVCANGFMNFGPDSTAFDNVPLPTGGTLPVYSMYPFWDDLFLPQANNTVFTATLGTQPTRKFICEWKTATFFADQAGQFNSISFQVVLFEGSNDIEFRYQEVRGPLSNGSSATIGLEDNTGRFANQYLYNGSPAERQVTDGLVIRWSSYALTIDDPATANPNVAQQSTQNDGRNRAGSSNNHHLCFVTNAAYGTQMAEEVKLLSRFRDVFLMPTGPGRDFIDFYYTSSPPLARLISAEEGLKLPIQMALLPPIWFASFLLFSTAAEKALVAGLLLALGMVMGRAMCRRLAETER